MSGSIESQHPEYSKHLTRWEDCRNFFEGEDTVKYCTTRYLPQPAAANTDEYAAYVKRAFFYGVVEPTIYGLTGAVYRKQPTHTLPPNIEYIIQNADDEGNALCDFSKNLFIELMMTGRVGVLIDRPTDGGDAYMTMYAAEDIVNWQYTYETGVTLVVLREIYYEQDSQNVYGQSERTRYRELYFDEDGYYSQRLWYDTGASEEAEDHVYRVHETVTPSKNGVRLKTIPFVFINTKSLIPDIDKPPLLELVRKNNEHYRVSADYANSLYFAGQPILWVKGVDESELRNLKIGSSYAFSLGNPDAALGYLEVSGGGISPNKQRCDDIKLEMAVLGARLLEGPRTGVEAAETAAIRQNAEMSKLMTIVTSISNGVSKALRFISEWEGGAPNNAEIKYTLNTDFNDVSLNPALITALSSMVDKEHISWSTFFYNLAIGEIIPAGRTEDEERGLIEGQPPMSPGRTTMQEEAISQSSITTEKGELEIEAMKQQLGQAQQLAMIEQPTIPVEG